ncbi:hypothetical protein BRC71_06575 [Halobacteriales archaeon QH_7_65_31]|nr:MAG: hypothetical protein BRC71_06575 [Halobacteriales archaeon QH_7_65_31]
MNKQEPVTRRQTLLKAGVVSLAGMTAGCSSSEDMPELDIQDISAETTDAPRIRATMVVSNNGGAVGTPLGTIKVERNGDLLGQKKQKMTVIPKSEAKLVGDFGFVDYDRETTYTVSGTIPGYDWVTPDDV